MPRLSTSISFKKGAETAAAFYIAAFQSAFGHAAANVLATTYFGAEELAALDFLPEEDRPGPAGSVCTIRFQLNGLEFTAVNGGNYFGKFHESICIYVNCDTQDQLDTLWGAFAADAQEIQPCGWIKDRFGVSWQIVPASLQGMTEDPDRGKAQRVLTALYAMKKVDAEALRLAYTGG
jgi:predicted 3-demethylubiquinone-9 3-methyltransferase (glyoxalase superfamily)